MRPKSFETQSFMELHPMRNDGKVRRKRKVPQAYSPADESAGSLTAFGDDDWLGANGVF